VFAVPDSFTIEIQIGGKWIRLAIKDQRPAKPVGNTGNTLVFDKVTTIVSG
jgi:hypothetical protein